MARPIDTRKFLKDLKRFLDRHAIDVAVDTRRGKGSHYNVILVHRTTGDSATFTLADGPEISQGVQRRLGERAADLAIKSPIYAVAREAFRRLFDVQTPPTPPPPPPPPAGRHPSRR